MEIPQNLAIKSFPPAGLLRRFAAILYDSLLLFSVLFFATGLFLVVIPMESSTQPIFRIYILMVSFLYFAWSWLRGGQTLGMMAWQIQLQPIEGKQITLWLAVRRFVMAIFSWLILGLGFFWAIWDKEGRTWHDWASETRLVWLRTENKS
jgi:uncharacterized RDD family membrane protein YckC